MRPTGDGEEPVRVDTILMSSIMPDTETRSIYSWRQRSVNQQVSWSARRQREMAVWDSVLPALVNAYLQHLSASSGETACPPSTQIPHIPPQMSSDPGPVSPGPEASESFPDIEMLDATSAASEDAGCVSYTLRVYDLFTLQTEVTIQRPQNSVSPVLDLVKNGYIPKTPTQPKIAVSVKTLQLLYYIRQRKPSFSIEAFAKVVCDAYNVRLSLSLPLPLSAISNTDPMYLDTLPPLRARCLRRHFRDLCSHSVSRRYSRT